METVINPLNSDHYIIQINSVSDEEKQVERMYWTLRYASQLAKIPLGNLDETPTQAQMEKAKKDLQKMIDKLKSDSVPTLSDQNAERQRLVEKLEVIVEFVLRLTIHPVHPQKTECRKLLGTV